MEEKRMTVVFDGDSICTASDDNFRGWAARVGEALGADWFNYGRGGGTVTAEIYFESGVPRHWVSRNLTTLREKHPHVDYLILEGGTNDADLLGYDSPRFGKITEDGEPDDTTFLGAMEALFLRARALFPEAKIGFIVAQKMGIPRSETVGFYNRRRYFEAAIEVAKKHGIPYIDLWEESVLDPRLVEQYDPSLPREENIALGKPFADGQHLTTVGYDMTADAVIEFVKSL